MMVLNKQDYFHIAQDLLAQRDTYRLLTVDPTNKHKNKLINMFKPIKAGGGLGDTTYKRLYVTGTSLQKFMGYPTSTKGHPLGP